jgi:hypothetical protein
MSPYFYVMAHQEQGKFILFQIQHKQPINCVYTGIDGGTTLKVVLLSWYIYSI